jgi:peptide/nickel transport system ATP-binding protein
MTDAKLRLDGVHKHFPVNTGLVSRLLDRGERRYVRAVDDVSLELEEGEAFGLAGESGCGKTTLGKSVVRLHDLTDGHIYFDEEEVTDVTGSELMEFRRDAQMIHQNPFESLNPRFTVYRLVREPLDIHGIADKEERDERVYETLERVGLRPAEAYAFQRPPMLSGGERQRVGIARALVLEPSFMLADEPVSMLDVSIRASILELFNNLQRNLGLTALYISHDLSMLKYMCDRIGIMYLGRIVEVAPANQIINDPKHPYTQALVDSIPRIDPDVDRDPVDLPGGVPDPIDLPSGCRFAPRCSHAMAECEDGEPEMYDVGDEQDARCILYDEDIVAEKEAVSKASIDR